MTVSETKWHKAGRDVCCLTDRSNEKWSPSKRRRPSFYAIHCQSCSLSPVSHLSPSDWVVSKLVWRLSLFEREREKRVVKERVQKSLKTSIRSVKWETIEMFSSSVVVLKIHVLSVLLDEMSPYGSERHSRALNIALWKWIERFSSVLWYRFNVLFVNRKRVGEVFFTRESGWEKST
jgi:hypothetical protein